MIDVFNQGLAQPHIRQQSFCPRPCERKHPTACPTDVFFEVQVLVNQPTKDAIDALFSYLCVIFINNCSPASKRTG